MEPYCKVLPINRLSKCTKPGENMLVDIKSHVFNQTQIHEALGWINATWTDLSDALILKNYTR